MDCELTPRRLRHWFGRIALALLVYSVVSRLLTTGVLLLWSGLLGQTDYTQAVILNDLCVYLPGLVLLPLLLQGLPRLEPLERHSLGGQEGFLAVTFSMGTGYLCALVGVGVIRVLELLTARSAGNPVSDLQQSLPPLISVVAFVLVAPLAEEFLFRGLLLERTRFLGDGAAMLINGTAFALLHENLNQTLYAFTLGAVFSAIVLMTGRLRYTIAIHMLINGVSEVLAFDPALWLQTLLSSWALFCILLAICLFLARRRRYTLDPGPLPFTEGEKLRACFSSPWTWLLLGLGLASSVRTVFR